ncbi:MAG: FhaA domain-containing protein [Candidatus Limnocylindrales bacterium]
MSGPFATLERFFERALERPAARLFRAGVEPVQVRHRLERAMDAARHGPEGDVPSRYRVRVNPADLAGLGDAIPSFAEALVARAHSQRYRLAARPQVMVVGDKAVAAGDVVVEIPLRTGPGTEAPEGTGSRGRGDQGDPVAGAAHAAEGLAAGPARADAGDQVPSGRTRETGESGDPDRTGALGASGPSGAPGADLSGPTMVFEVAQARVPRALLLVQTPGAAPRRYPLLTASVRLGRSPENDLVLPDPRVSREHGLLSARQGGLVYSDLGSRNGSFVNGVRVREVGLGPGDVLRVGDSTVTVSGVR